MGNGAARLYRRRKGRPKDKRRLLRKLQGPIVKAKFVGKQLLVESQRIKFRESQKCEQLWEMEQQGFIGVVRAGLKIKEGYQGNSRVHFLFLFFVSLFFFDRA